MFSMFGTAPSSIVMANMHLEASASGVSSYWIQGRIHMAADGRSTQSYISELLGVPEPWQLEAVPSLSIPGKQPKHRKFDEILLEKAYEGHAPCASQKTL